MSKEYMMIVKSMDKKARKVLTLITEVSAVLLGAALMSFAV